MAAKSADAGHHAHGQHEAAYKTAAREEHIDVDALESDLCKEPAHYTLN